MAIFNMIEENEATGKVKEVYEDIKKKRNVKFITNFWKMLANEPDTLERTWNSLQQVMKKGALDEMTKELIYVAKGAGERIRQIIKDIPPEYDETFRYWSQKVFL